MNGRNHFQQSFFYKIIHALVIFSFLSTGILPASAQSSLGEKPPSSLTSETSTNVSFLDSLSIPKENGRIRELYIPEGNGNQKTIIHIADAHCNPKGQKNIQLMLEQLIQKDGFELIGVEGAQGWVNTTVLNRGTPEKREAVCQEYLEKGLLTGSEALGMKYGDSLPFKIYGVEDTKAYLSNFMALKDAFSERQSVRRFQDELKKLMEKIKAKLFTSPLFSELDKKYEDFSEGRLKRGDYILYLSGLCQGNALDKNGQHLSEIETENSPFPNFRETVQTARLEKSIDFKRLNEEQTSLFQALKKELPEEDVQELNEKETLFKQGLLAPLGFYESVWKGSLKLENKPLADNLQKYLDILTRFKKVRTEKLMGEIREITQSLKLALCENEDQLSYVRLDYCVTLLERMTDLRLTREQLLFYKNHEEDFSVRNLLNWPREKAEELDIPWPRALTEDSFSIPFALESAKDYYHGLIRRDDLLCQNLLQKMDEEGTDKAILITGGFHTEGMTDLMRQQGIAYAVLSPVVGQATDLYYQVMMDSGLSVEKAYESAMAMGLAPALITDMHMGLSTYQIVEGIVTKLEGGVRSAELNQSQPAAFDLKTLTKTQKIVMQKRLQNLQAPGLHLSSDVTDFLESLSDQIKNPTAMQREITEKGVKKTETLQSLLVSLDQFGRKDFKKAFESTETFEKEDGPSGWELWKRSSWAHDKMGLLQVETVKEQAKVLMQNKAKYSDSELRTEMTRIANELQKALEDCLTQGVTYQNDLLRITKKTLFYLRETIPPESEIHKGTYEAKALERSRERMKYLTEHPSSFSHTGFHGTGSPVLQGMKKTEGKLMSLKALQDAGIVPTTGEGVSLSEGNKVKREVFICKVDETDLSGLGASLAYANAALELPQYNIKLWTPEELQSNIEDLELALAIRRHNLISSNGGALKGQPKGTDFQKHFWDNALAKKLDFRFADRDQITKWESQLDAYRKELAARMKLAADDPVRRGGKVTREDSYPVLFEFDTTGIGMTVRKDTKGGFISGESTVDYSLDLKPCIKRAYAPAKVLPHLQKQLQELYGKDIEVLALEALNESFQTSNPNLAKEGFEHLQWGQKSLQTTFNGIQRLQGGGHHVIRQMADSARGFVKEYRENLEKWERDFKYSDFLRDSRKTLTDYNTTPNATNLKALREYRLKFRQNYNAIQAQYDVVQTYLKSHPTEKATHQALLDRLEPLISTLRQDMETLYAAEDLLRQRKQVPLSAIDGTTPSLHQQVTLPAINFGNIALSGAKLKATAFARDTFTSTFQSHVLESFYKRIFPYHYAGTRAEYGTKTAQEISQPNGETPYYRTIMESDSAFGSREKRLDNYFDFIDYLYEKDHEKGKVPRSAHGAGHACRVALYSELLTSWHLSKTALKATESQTLKSEIQTVQIAMGLHDAGRMDEGRDYYDPISADITRNFFEHTELDENVKKKMHSLVAHKDDTLTQDDVDFPLDTVTKLQHDIVHDADVMDVMRAKYNFDAKYMRSYTSADEATRKEMDSLIDEIKGFLKLTGNDEIESILEFESADYYTDMLKILKAVAAETYLDDKGKPQPLFGKMSLLLADALAPVEAKGPVYDKLKPVFEAKLKELKEDRNRQAKQAAAKGTGGTLRQTGKDTDYTGIRTKLKTKETEFKSIADRESATTVVIEADFGKDDSTKDITIPAYNFEKDGKTIIVLNTKFKEANPEKFNAIKEEILFHERSEIAWTKKLKEDTSLDEATVTHRAHILASIEQTQKYGKQGITSFHALDLESKNEAELQALVTEFNTGRADIYAALAWAKSNDSNFPITKESVELYEKKFISKALYELNKRKGKGIKDYLVSLSLLTTLFPSSSVVITEPETGKFDINGKILVSAEKISDLAENGQMGILIDALGILAKSQTPDKTHPSISSSGLRLRFHYQLAEVDAWIQKRTDPSNYTGVKALIKTDQDKARIFDLVNESSVSEDNAKKAIQYAMAQTPVDARSFANYYTFYLNNKEKDKKGLSDIQAQAKAKEEYDKRLAAVTGTVAPIKSLLKVGELKTLTPEVLLSKIKGGITDLNFESAPAGLSHSEKHPLQDSPDFNSYLSWAKKIIKVGTPVSVERNQSDLGWSVSYKYDEHEVIVRISPEGDCFIATYMPRRFNSKEAISGPIDRKMIYDLKEDPKDKGPVATRKIDELDGVLKKLSSGKTIVERDETTDFSINGIKINYSKGTGNALISPVSPGGAYTFRLTEDTIANKTYWDKTLGFLMKMATLKAASTTVTPDAEDIALLLECYKDQTAKTLSAKDKTCAEQLFNLMFREFNLSNPTVLLEFCKSKELQAPEARELYLALKSQSLFQSYISGTDGLAQVKLKETSFETGATPELINHFLNIKKADKESDFRNSGVSGGHLDEELIAFEKSNPAYHFEKVMEVNPSTTMKIKVYEQYLWKGTGTPDLSNLNNPNWVKSQVPKTTTNNIKEFLLMGDLALLEATKSGQFDKKGPKSQRLGRDGYKDAPLALGKFLTATDGMELFGRVVQTLDKKWIFTQLAVHSDWIEKKSTSGFIGAGNNGSAKLVTENAKTYLEVTEEGKTPYKTAVTDVFDEDGKAKKLSQKETQQLAQAKTKTLSLLDSPEVKVFLRKMGIPESELAQAVLNSKANLENLFSFAKVKNSKEKYVLSGAVENQQGKLQIGFDEAFLRTLLEKQENFQGDASLLAITLFHEALESITPVGAHDQIRELQKSLFATDDKNLTHFIHAFNLSRQLKDSMASESKDMDEKAFREKLFSFFQNPGEENLKSLMEAIYTGQVNLKVLDQVLAAAQKAGVDTTPVLTAFLYKEMTSAQADKFLRVERILSRLGVSSYEVKEILKTLNTTLTGVTVDAGHLKGLDESGELILATIGSRILDGQYKNSETRKTASEKVAQVISELVTGKKEDLKAATTLFSRILMDTEVDTSGKTDKMAKQTAALMKQIQFQKVLLMKFSDFMESADEKNFEINSKTLIKKDKGTIKLVFKQKGKNKEYTEEEFQKKSGFTFRQYLALQGAIKSNEEISQIGLDLRTKSMEGLTDKLLKTGDRKSLFVVNGDMSEQEIREVLSFLQKTAKADSFENHKITGDTGAFIKKAEDLGLLDKTLSRKILTEKMCIAEDKVASDFQKGTPLIILGRGAKLQSFNTIKKTIILDTSNSMPSSMVGLFAFLKKDKTLIESLQKSFEAPNALLTDLAANLTDEKINKLTAPLTFLMPEIKPILDTILSQIADEEETVLIAG